MKLKILILNFSFLILTACGITKPVSMAHVERIEERVMPIPVGADTIEIELCRDTRLECPITREGQNPTSTASSNLCKSDERLLTKSKQRIKKELKNQSDLCNLWETTHSEGVKSVQICRATSCAARERIDEKEELESEQSVSSVGDKTNEQSESC